MKNKENQIKSRSRFFDITIKNKNFKKSISSEKEECVKKILESLNYVEDKDFFHQHPVLNKYVLDFAFPSIKVNIEVDGVKHLKKKEIEIDAERDSDLYDNGWVVIRMQDYKFTSFTLSFYRNLIREVVEERKDTHYEDTFTSDN